MFKDCKKWLKAAVFAALMGFAPEMYAQAVIFPQEEKPGDASLVFDQTKQEYTLSNQLLTVTFHKEGDKLTFGGCPQMDLEPSAEIFQVQLGNGSEKVNASQMKLVSVTDKNLDADLTKAKGSLRIPGKAIEAVYTYGNLTITWRAVLRNGSHYFRTEMDIITKEGTKTKMFAIIPMMYDMINKEGVQVPETVGNTRGAILISDKIFAGLETPMGINTIESDSGMGDVAGFQATSWNTQAYKWQPEADQVPPTILAQGTIDQKGVALEANQVVAARGFIKCYETGQHELTFKYGGGGHKLNLVGVDLLDLNGNIIQHDYHLGKTGDKHEGNVYRFNVEKAGLYQIRYFVETKTETIQSWGSITYNKKVAVAQVLFDGKANGEQTVTPPVTSTNPNFIAENDSKTYSQLAANWQTAADFPLRIGELGFAKENIKTIDQNVEFGQAGRVNVTFQWMEGNNRLNLAGVVLLNEQGQEVRSAIHKGFTGNENKDNVYSMEVPSAGKYKLRYYAEQKTNPIDSKVDVTVNMQVDLFVHMPAPKAFTVQGKWSRNTELLPEKPWKVSSVVGLVAPGQKRRSVLSYVERERAVPWRAYPIYNSWYELNINRNNDPNYDGNMHDYQCEDITRVWQKQLYETYGVGIKAFVWDDGWDKYGTWEFNKNFPHGFDEVDRLAKQMNSGIGAWLGPVGGYGESGNYRRDYWKQPGMGGMRLSNPKYYKVFKDACDNLLNKRGYDFRYFKFDGISGQFSSVGPDGGTEGEENAEGIIYAELDMRTLKDDVFFNTSVGTWASPFWFSITDAVWRQEKDYGTVGNNKSDRENWITYRDGLVYSNFVKNSPMCPINNLMTHGFILADPKHGVSRDQNYAGIVREMRCAFACGSAMVELYNDYALMNTISDATHPAGSLWGELAKCIEWQEKNAEVLPDAHWVGGNPWDGSKCNVYGWAGWNGKNAVLTLRNGANDPQTFTTTLREALDIPAYVTKGTKIRLNKGFADQEALEGFADGTEIDIDATLNLKLKGSSVYVFDNTVAKVIENYVIKDLSEINNRTAYTIKSVDRGYVTYDPADKDFVRSSFTDGHRQDAEPTGAVNEQFAFISHDSLPAGHFYMYAMGAKKFVSTDYVDSKKMRLTVEPIEAVSLTPVSNTADNNQFVIKFGNKILNLTSYQDYFGTKLVAGASIDNGNKMTIMAVNHKAGLSTARSKVAEVYKYQRLSREGWEVTADSWCYDNNEKTQGQPSNVLDGKVNTFWHSNWKGSGGTGDAAMPYILTFDLKTPQKFCSFAYNARIDSENGVIKSYALDISNDKTNWQTVKSGQLNMTDRKFAWADLEKTVEAQYVRLTIASNHQTGNQASLACMSEFYLGYDGSEVSPEIHNLPLFTTEEAPTWYPVYFKNGNPQGYIEDKGVDQIMMTAAKAEKNEQKWQFIGNENSYIMKNAANHYVYFADGYFKTTADRAKASELQFVQAPSYYLEIKVKGASSNMNQDSGQGVGKQLSTWTPGDPGNILQVAPVLIPAPELPEFGTAWYLLKFKNGGRVIENKGVGASARLAEVDVAADQAWKFEGNPQKFQIVTADGKYLVVSNEQETNCGNQAGAQPHPLRVENEAYAPGFKLVASQNSNGHAPAWEIGSNDTQFNGKTFNMHAGNQVDRVIGQYNVNDNNNPMEFVEVGALDIKTAEGFGTVYSDKAYTMPVGVKGSTVTGVTPGANNIGTLKTAWEYAAGQVVPANTALVVKHETTEPQTHFFAYSTESPAAPEVNWMKGQLVDGPIVSESNTYYYKLTYSMEEGQKVLGFFWGAANGAAFSTKAGKAYLAVPQSTASNVRGFRLTDDGITGIDSVVSEEGETAIYNLAGVRMNVEFNELPKGVYIVNGKKVIVK